MTTYHDTTGQTCTACVKVAASPICGAEQSDWVCTRDPGHDSVHIACGARHGAAYWVKEPTAASTAPVCCGPLDEDVAFWHAHWHEAADQRDDRDAAAHAWKEHSREMFRQRQDARTELDRFQRLAGGWITEAQSETTEAVTRAEAAELRAEKAEQPRPLTTDNFTEAARAEAERVARENTPLEYGSIWDAFVDAYAAGLRARTHLTTQEESVLMTSREETISDRLSDAGYTEYAEDEDGGVTWVSAPLGEVLRIVSAAQ